MCCVVYQAICLELTEGKRQKKLFSARKTLACATRELRWQAALEMYNESEKHVTAIKTIVEIGNQLIG